MVFKCFQYIFLFRSAILSVWVSFREVTAKHLLIFRDKCHARSRGRVPLTHVSMRMHILPQLLPRGQARGLKRVSE